MGHADIGLWPTDSRALRWLKRLFAVDILLFVVAVTLPSLIDIGTIRSAHPDLLLAGDTTLTERFNHLKWLAVVILMATLFWRTRAPVFLALAALYGLILVDDAGRLHEQGGARIARHFDWMTDIGISASQAGELVVWLLLGLLLLPLLALAALCTPRKLWAELVPLAVAFVGLFAAAIVVDVAHDMLSASYRAAGTEEPRLVWLTMVLIENVGEAFFASLTAASAIGIAVRHGLLAHLGSFSGRASVPALAFQSLEAGDPHR